MDILCELCVLCNNDFGSVMVPQESKDRLNGLVKELIGDMQKLKTSRKTSFKRSHRAKNIENCPRAFSFATSYEAPRKSRGSHVSMKVTEEWGSDCWLLFRKELLQVFSPFRCCPPHSAHSDMTV